MSVSDFLLNHNLSAGQICAANCLERLLKDMELGLRGEGNIPMIPSYLSASIAAPEDRSCCVLDAGGTNLRAGRAIFDARGNCRIENLTRVPMPGTQAPMGKEEFYAGVARLAQSTGAAERIGFCFSYNVLVEPTLDGVLLGWCKEVQIPDAVGHPVGALLKSALGDGCRSVHVLNDSVAAMLGASTPERTVQVGIILGTGINVCYEEKSSAILKIEAGHRSSMIISTEVGEFDGFPKSDLDLALFQLTEDPRLAHGEKQCAGGYLGDLICLAWRQAAVEGLLEESFLDIQCSLPQISAMLEGEDSGIPRSEDARRIAEALIHRAAKIAAVLCAGPVLRCTENGGRVTIAVEGSQFYKLFGFRKHFQQELEGLLQDRGISFEFVHSENACLKGAALAAFSQPVSVI